MRRIVVPLIVFCIILVFASCTFRMEMEYSPKPEAIETPAIEAPKPVADSHSQGGYSISLHPQYQFTITDTHTFFIQSVLTSTNSLGNTTGLTETIQVALGRIVTDINVIPAITSTQTTRFVLFIAQENLEDVVCSNEIPWVWSEVNIGAQVQPDGSVTVADTSQLPPTTEQIEVDYLCRIPLDIDRDVFSTNILTDAKKKIDSILQVDNVSIWVDAAILKTNAVASGKLALFRRRLSGENSGGGIDEILAQCQAIGCPGFSTWLRCWWAGCAC